MKIGTDISLAAERIKTGRLVAFPTETVFGLGANALDEQAVASIFAAKGRPSFNPLIIHVENITQAKKLVEWNSKAELLAQHFWAGALTLVLPRKSDSPVSLLASAGLDSIAVRMPAHPIAQQLIAKSGVPIAAPSANISGKISATKAQHVAEDFTTEDVYILDESGSEIGLESTVLDCTTPKITLLRSGAITREAIEKILGQSLEIMHNNNENPSSPGQLSSHYAPTKKLRLNAKHVYPYEALLAFGTDVPAGARVVMNISEQGDLQEAAANLFATLRALDATDAKSIAAMRIPNVGLGEAINDRLNRASA
jgi:L-threonylcarbamoyladenylate synthase